MPGALGRAPSQHLCSRLQRPAGPSSLEARPPACRALVGHGGGRRTVLLISTVGAQGHLISLQGRSSQAARITQGLLRGPPDPPGTSAWFPGFSPQSGQVSGGPHSPTLPLCAPLFSFLFVEIVLIQLQIGNQRWCLPRLGTSRACGGQLSLQWEQEAFRGRHRVLPVLLEGGNCTGRGCGVSSRAPGCHPRGRSDGEGGLSLCASSPASPTGLHAAALVVSISLRPRTKVRHWGGGTCRRPLGPSIWD